MNSAYILRKLYVKYATARAGRYVRISKKWHSHFNTMAKQVPPGAEEEWISVMFWTFPENECLVRWKQRYPMVYVMLGNEAVTRWSNYQKTYLSRGIDLYNIEIQTNEARRQVAYILKNTPKEQITYMVISGGISKFEVQAGEDLLRNAITEEEWNSISKFLFSD